MLALRPTSAWQTDQAATVGDRHGAFFTVRPAAASRSVLLVVDRIAQLWDEKERRELTDTVAAATRRGLWPDVAITDIERGTDLVLAAIIALHVHFRWPKLSVTAYADPQRLNADLYLRFERAMGKPRRLLQLLDQATFARVHYLMGQDDDDGLRTIGPLLGFVDLIAGDDRRLARQLARRLDINKRNLQLMVTRRCQLRCVYCPADKRDEDLALTDALRAVDLLLQSENESFRVDFAGGEPLLRKDWVRQVIATCHERAQRAGKRDSYYLVTNAIELDDDFCRFLTDYDIELEVSIDGDETSHNRNTTTVVQGVNPYRALLSGFEHLKKYDLQYNAVLVFTPDTLPALRGNLEHIVSLGFRNIAINYAIGYEWDREIIERYVELLVEFVERYDMLSRGEAAPMFIKNLLHKSEPTVLNSELMVDTDGSLHLLSEWQFKQALRRHAAPFGYHLDELQSIDEVFFTKAQVYHLLYEVYRSKDRATLRTIHNSVQAGLLVARLLRERLGQKLS